MTHTDKLANHLTEGLKALGNAVPTANADGTRDWPTFFAALATFMAQLLPLLIPLFSKTKS
jgi:hypothetical protein